MAKRIDEIRQKVETEGEVFVSDLSRIYNVTEETIRRDLEKLKNDGIITRTFGGAVLNTTPQNDRVHFFKRKGINLEGKKKIAKLLVDKFIGVNTMMIDNSTTVLEAVKLFKDNENLTAITFSAQIFQELDTCKMKLVSTGGLYDEKTRSFYGKPAKEAMKKYNVDLVLLGCKGLDMERGITDSSEGDMISPSSMLRSKPMASRAECVVLLADHSKFNHTAFVNFLDWDRIDYLITDEKPSQEWLEFCEQMKIKLMY